MYFITAVILLLISGTDTKKVPILDTTQLSSLHWTTHTLSSAAEDGWLEESYTSVQEGINWRTYVVCDVRKETVDNWVRMPFILRGEARRLSVEMTFTMRDCKMFPHTARTCKETFTLLAYEADFDFATKESPEWTDRQSSTTGNGYRRIDRITADNGRFTSKENIVMNTETRNVPVTKKGVYLAFRDEGACISLISLKVYYEVCEEVVTNFAWFGETAVGPNLTSIQETIGHCVDNASPPSPGAQPKYVCKADGTWDLLSGGCQCNPGYRPDGNRCIACDAGFYKDSPGLAGCLPCPSRSSSKNVGSAYCECEAGFYRAPSDSKSAPCTRPPSRPIDLKVLKTEQTRAVLSWRQPEDLGGRPTLWYRVECPECPPDVQYTPSKKLFNTTTLTLANLVPASLYTIFIYAENDISPQVDSLPMYAIAEVNTRSTSATSGAYVVDLRVDAVTSNELNVSWTLPTVPYASELVGLKSNGDNDHLSTGQQRPQNFYYYYAVRLYIRDAATQQRRLVSPNSYRGVANGNNETSMTHVPRFTFFDLQPNTEYGFQVQANAAGIGPGSWSEISWTRTLAAGVKANGELAKPNELHGESVSNVVVPIICAVLIAVVVVGLGCYIRRQRRPNLCSGEKQPSDLDVLDYKSGPLHMNRHNLHSTSTPDYNSAATLSRKMASPLVPQFNSSMTPFRSTFKQYVDPLAYEDPNHWLQEFASEVDSSRVIIEEIIGRGEFGEVCKGKLRMAGVREDTVAIKTLKTDLSDKAKADFLTEASIMGQFDHPNVIKLRGVVTKTVPVMIITEYMENGSLDTFLKANDGRLETLQLVSMLYGIASGMEYLSSKGYVHRDLAARNVLVDASFSCKIADFGLSRGMEGSVEQVYTTRGGKIPVRWTAPEAIKFRKFTSASDVWSFGVVMWEVMSYGERPYWDWTNQQVIQAVDQNNFRLPAPMDCPPQLHQLMLQCWQTERKDRPTFSAILQKLHSFLQCPEQLYACSTISSISSPLGVSNSGGSLASLTSSGVLQMHFDRSHCGGHPSTGTSSGFVSSATSGAGAYQMTNGTSSPARSLLSRMTLDNLLRDINLHHLTSVFLECGYRNVMDLNRLTPMDMAKLGLQHYEQKRLTDALNRLNRPVSYSHHYPPAPPTQSMPSSNGNEGPFV